MHISMISIILNLDFYHKVICSLNVCLSRWKETLNLKLIRKTGYLSSFLVILKEIF
jgi:hypothetical protein